MSASCVKTGPNEPGKENPSQQEQGGGKQEKQDEPGGQGQEPETPVDPRISVVLDVTDGLMDYTGAVSCAGAKVSVTGKVSCIFRLDLSIDGKPSSQTSTLVENIKPGVPRSVEFPRSLSLGRHTYAAELSVQQGEEKIEPVKFSGEFWMMGEALTGATSRVVTRTKNVVLDKDVTLSLYMGESGSLELDYKPENTVVSPAFSTAKSGVLLFDSSKLDIAPGHFSVPFEVKESAVTTLDIRLVNGKDTLRLSYPLDTTEEPLKTVQEVTVPESVGITLGQPGSFTVSVFPENAIDAKVVSAVSSSEDLAVTSVDGLTVNLEGKWPGDYSVDIEVGDAKIRKTVPVKVTGSVVTGFVPSTALDGSEVGYGRTVDLFIYPDPSDAYDANTVVVESSDPSVVSVIFNGSHSYTLKGLDFGEADIKASTRGAGATYHVRVPETLSFEKESFECAYDFSTSFEVGGDYRGFTLSVEDREVSGQMDLGYCSVKLEGKRITVRNTNRTLQDRKVVLTVKTSVFSVMKSVTVLVKGMSDTVSFTGSNAGIQADGKVYFDFSIVNEKMEAYTVKSFYGYLVCDSSYQMEYIEKCEEVLRNGPFMDDITVKPDDFTPAMVIARSYNVKYESEGFPESVAPGETATFRWSPSKTGDDVGDYNGEAILVGRIETAAGVEIVWF